MHACARTRTRAGAVIFVQRGAQKFSKMCVRVHACAPRRYECAPHVRTLFFFVKNLIFSKKTKKNIFFWHFFFEKCAGAGEKNGVRVRAPHITNFVRCACGCEPKSPHTKGLVVGVG